MKRAAIYARVSTDEQAEKGYSLPSQLESMREYAQRYDFEIVAEITDDCSGTIPVSERPGGAQVYQYLNSRRVDAIILYTIDRTARDKRDYPIEFLIFLRDVQDAGAELYFVDTGKSEGSIVDLFKAWQAGDERKKIRERSMRGKVAKARAGKWVGDSKPPYGYRRSGYGRDSRLEVYEPDAAIVQRIFRMYTGIGEKRVPLLVIAERLTSEGIPAPGNSGRGGEFWYAYTVKRIVRNPAYTGKFSYSHKTVGLDFPDLAIISPDVWQLAQEQTKKNRELGKRNNKKFEYLLRGRLKCNCGLSLIGLPVHANNQYYFYYACGRFRGDRHIYSCKESYLLVKQTDALVWDWLYGLIDDDDKLTEGIRTWQRQNIDQADARRSRIYSLDDLIARAERTISRLAAAYRRAENDVEAEALDRERKIAVREFEAFSAEREELGKKLAEVELTPEREDYIRLVLRSLRARLGNASIIQKQEILDLFQFSGQIAYQDGQRGLLCICKLVLDPKFLAFDNRFSKKQCD